MKLKPVQILAILLVSMLIISFVIIFLNKDVITSPPTPQKPPSFLSINEVDVKPIKVTSSTIEVNVTSYLNHIQGKTNNAYLLIRAINSNNGLLGNQVSTQIPETESKKTISVSSHIELERNGNYELKILVFDNGTIQDSGSVKINGLNALTPDSKQSGVILSNIDFRVNNVSKESVVISSNIYFENRATESSDDLKIILKAREANSNLLADSSTSQTGIIKSESTVIKNIDLNVPDGYNYIIVTELWRGESLVNIWEKPVLLAPTKTLPKESLEKEIKIEVSDFVKKSEIGGGVASSPMSQEVRDSYGGAYTPQKQESGFEIIIGIIAFIIVVIFRRRMKC